MSFSIIWNTTCEGISEQLWALFFPEPTEGLWWYRILEKSQLNDQFTFYYALVMKNNTPIALIPAFIFNFPLDIGVPSWIARWNPFGYLKTLFIGNPLAESHIGYHQMDDEIMTHINSEIKVKAKLLNASFIVWKDFSGPVADTLNAIKQKMGLFRVPSYPGTGLAVQQDMDSYLKTLRPKERKNYLYWLRTSKKRCDPLISIVNLPDLQLIKELFPLFMQTYEKGKTKFEKLTPAFFEEMAKHPNVTFILIRDRVTEKLMAFAMCTLSKSLIRSKFIGIDYSLKNYLLGYLLYDLTYRWAISIGAKEIYQEQSAYRKKIDFGYKLLPYYNYCQHLNPILNKMFYLITKKMTWSDVDPELSECIKGHPEILQDLDPSTHV